jgi:uncharacterized cofD-like protein
VLKCALTLARNEREARKILLARLPSIEHERLAGHTGGNLLLSMMEQYTGDFLAAVDGLRSLLGCRGHVWPITTERSSICALYGDGSTGRGEVEVDARQISGQTVERLWLDPPASVHPRVRDVIRSLDAGDHRSRAVSSQACCRFFSSRGAARRSPRSRARSSTSPIC